MYKEAQAEESACAFVAQYGENLQAPKGSFAGMMKAARQKGDSSGKMGK
ncbi:hypothetical protein JQM64_00855 [Fournierella massiliensis]|nr:hypothetical protein [Fournierella massiliensis]MCF2556096.1 hypothetical protein [Fournierella massiliensis]